MADEEREFGLNRSLSWFGPEQVAILKALYSLFEGKSNHQRMEIAEDVVAYVRSIARGDKPLLRTDPLNKEEHARERWARHVAQHFLDAALMASERSPEGGPPPDADQRVMLREIATLALWHMPDAVNEARALVRVMTIERFKRDHPRDEPAVPEGHS